MERHQGGAGPFCRLTQDGDSEGCLHLARLPSSAEAELIRSALGIRKRRRVNPAIIGRPFANFRNPQEAS
jgi:hypothetical protein